jgi:hypothetical protein
MKLALLGADDDSLNLVRWAVTQGDHELVAAYDSGLRTNELRELAPHLRTTQSWEELILASVADAVIVGRGGKELVEQTGIDHLERRADQLRKLTQAAVPMIAVCPACEAIIGFEIEMIRRDTKALILPYVPLGSHPVIDMLSEWVLQADESPIGTVEQIVLEREQTDRKRETVLVQLARDASLVREFLGTIQSVAASGPAPAIGRDPLGPKSKELPSLANLSVIFSGEDGLIARWTLARAEDGDVGRLKIVGDRGKAILTMPTGGDWSLHVPGKPVVSELAEPDDDHRQIFSWLAHAIENNEYYDADSWLNACRDQEAAEAVDRSLARGRTIELFNEEHTEGASFKGVMAMGGCLLLVMALGVLLVAVIVESLRLPIRGWAAWRAWPLYLLVPLAIFLLLQLLQLVVNRDPTTTVAAPAAGDNANRLG